MNFRMGFSISEKNTIGILRVTAFNLWIILRSIVILTTLNIPIHEYRMSFHLFMFSLISYSNVL